MAARYVSSQLIKTVTSGSKTVAAEFVDKTTAWVRPSAYPSAQLKNMFAAVVEQNMGSYSAQTTRVAMKESEHQSDVDKRMHYTVYELDSNGAVIQTRHIVQQV
ncbi:hypothetical protein P154DRAFT_573176 [Amniculicola lignicola CBS 123094]|uniref:Uncharacterized protein n=1 Tax=Amniculicola lignicola CBS 123094 TaxID=1392246 RepID=A0A6A5WS17_9PLEO|nr:hypothetical protein P154DRAFT_573176 [Amniculicola lignicola CBS 123094]